MTTAFGAEAEAADSKESKARSSILLRLSLLELVRSTFAVSAEATEVKVDTVVLTLTNAEAVTLEFAGNNIVHSSLASA